MMTSMVWLSFSFILLVVAIGIGFLGTLIVDLVYSYRTRRGAFRDKKTLIQQFTGCLLSVVISILCIVLVVIVSLAIHII